MADDVVIAKARNIERCLARVREEFAAGDIHDDFTRQDALVLNLQRACETAIDLAMHLVRVKRLGVPEESREAFALLADGGVIDAGLSERLQRMVGFRNIAVHAYQKLNVDVVVAIVTERLADFIDFVAAALRADG